ncbi:hypothetical protein QRD40_09375 [Comamonas sp. Y6]|uniref:Glycosyltransferase family 1 protein n=1 Tax=Comamonas resistens TaxID=3046670 RepID=A0ABY8SRC4_9BURK|nr:hypothetical protein [Comamonas resistens]MDL5036561.1 hypothetical protein [Comamonas resistens]WHS64899.1 hypothetical protein QMY55_20805 [Comamonas resistens]
MKRLVYLSPVPLNSPSQRPHHFVEWAHERLGCEVYWVEPYPVRLPRLSDVRRVMPHPKVQSSNLGPSWLDASWLKVLQAPSLPLEPLPGGAILIGWLQYALRQQLKNLLHDSNTWLVAGRPSGMALALCDAQQGRRVLYDVMDDMAQFSQGISRRWMTHTHQHLLTQAEAVWGSSEKIFQSLQGLTCAPPTLVRNGMTAPPVCPFDPSLAGGIGTSAHSQAPLILGYVGTLATWFDWQTLHRVAKALPQAQFHVYGPIEGTAPPTLPSNVQLLGPVPHDQVFALMRSWHAGLIPFLHNQLTQSVDPVKYYEYRACGLPVLSTMFGEMPHHAANDEGVWALETMELACLEERLRHWHQVLEQRHAEGLPLTPSSLKNATWAARFETGAKGCGWFSELSQPATATSLS